MLLHKLVGGLAMAAGFASAATTHEIQVGRASLHLFEPNETEAQVGDTLRFYFHPEKHSVARAEYMQPCQPIHYAKPTRDESFWSDFQIVAAGTPQEKLPWWEVKVNDTDPIFVYCSQKGACVKDQMVGVIWVDGNRTDVKGNTLTLAEHKSKTNEIKKELSPGDNTLPEGDASDAAATPAPVAKEPQGLSKGAIAGIAIGAVAGVAIIALLVYMFGRNKSLSETLRYSRPPSGKIAPLPAMSEGPNSPFSPTFPDSPAPGYAGETKSANAMVAPAPGYNQHDNNINAHQSWMSQSPTMRAQSPDSMAERGYNNGGMMSPNAFSPHNSFMPQQHQQQQPQPYHLQSSPTETPWSPGGYNWQNMQLQHEMGAGQERIAQQRQSGMVNGYPTQNRVAAPVELAGETSGNAVSAKPPVYRSALNESGEPVQKPEDKTPAVTTRNT